MVLQIKLLLWETSVGKPRNRSASLAEQLGRTQTRTISRCLMVQCPACKDYDVHSSRWAGNFERIAAGMMLRRPVRCYTCFRRFYTWQFLEVKPRGAKSMKNISVSNDETIQNLKVSA